MSSKRQFLFLDTNVLSYLVQAAEGLGGDNALPEGCSRQSLAATLHRIRREVRCGRLRLHATSTLLQELAGIGAGGNMDLYRACLLELRHLSDGKLLLHGAERIPLEARRGGRLSGAGLLLPEVEAEALWADMESGRRLAQIARDVEEQKRRYLEMERERRASVREKVLATFGHQAGVRDAVNKFRDALEAQTAEWCRDALAREGKEWGLGDDPRLWPHPRMLPSLWNLWSIRLADICAIAEGGSLKSAASFQFDMSHFADAAYADSVTADRRLLERARLVDRGAPRVLSLGEFVGRAHESTP